MTATQLRQQLRDYIDTAEEKKLKAIYTLLENDMTNSYRLSVEQREELDRRMADHQAGIGKTYSWEETLAIAEQAMKAQR